MTATRPVRVRFAPSPTGRLHIGGARTALFNWAFARHHGGSFILRVEDTDSERNTQESLDSILDSLRWLGLDWDEGPEKGGDFGPYFQSQRGDSYDQAAARGLQEGWLYRCFCTTERISSLKEELLAQKKNPHYDRCCRALSAEESIERGKSEPFALRFAVPDDEVVVVKDHIRGDVSFSSNEVEDWVAVRTGGMPTYNFVCVLDDAAMEISHVLRGEEHLVNTPKQILLCRALGITPPEFAHVPLILGEDGKKLSKRTGDTALGDYIDKGYPRAALFNFLCLLGFAIDDHTTVFNSQQLVAAFELKKINKSGAIFDTDKLAWLCGDYIRNTEVSALCDLVLPWLQDAGLVDGSEDRAWLEMMVAAHRERIGLYSELADQVAWLFKDDVVADDQAAKALADESAPAILGELATRLEAAADFPPADFHSWIKVQAEEIGVGMGKLMKPTRASLTGTLGGPPVEDILALLGRERALRRLRGA